MDAKQILRADLDDIIFENRNKAYGAYDIRKKYRDRVNLALLIAVTFVVLVLLSPYIAKLFTRPEVVVKETPHITTVNELKPPPPLEKLPPPPSTYIPPPPKNQIFTPPKAVEEKVEEKPPVELPKTPQVVTNSTSNGPVVYTPPPEVKVIEKPKQPEFQEYFDEQAVPPGGMAAYYKYLADHIKYPQQAIDANVQGTVQIRVYISAEGKVVDAKIFKDNVGYGCGEEALRVIKSMPPWKPGKVNGQPIPTTFPVPVKFVLH